jgi:uncharacterized membrane protein
MHPTVAIAIWATLFVATHLVISSDSVRTSIIARVGEQPFRGLYSLVAFGICATRTRRAGSRGF